MASDKKKYLFPMSRDYRDLERKIASREYKLYLEKQEIKKGWYEHLAGFAEKLTPIEPDKKTKEDLQAAIDFTGLKITPKAPMSLMILTVIVAFIAGILPLFLIGLQSYSMTVMLVLVGVGFSYYFLKYPINLVKKVRIQASSQVVIAILYMVVSMRISPNLERALRFAAANVTGRLALDLRRLMWDIWMRKYNSADEAISEYIVKWKPENGEFAEALRLIRDSQLHPPEIADKTLDEALEVILEGTETRMKHYTQDLRTPVMVIHMMGIILPILGTVMAPLVAAFMGDVVRTEYFIFGYNIMLPLFILWFINNTLQKRPVTFSQIDIEGHPDVPPPGAFLIKRGKKRTVFPVLPIALIIAILLLLPAVYYFIQNPSTLLPAQPAKDGAAQLDLTLALMMSILIVLGIGVSLSVYFILTTFQSNRVQKDIEATEGEFELALFQLGNRIASGIPIESAMARSISDLKDLEISNLFKISVYNMQQQGMTLEDSIFNKKYGSIRYYPSRLIHNIMYTVIDTTKKGYSYAANAMMTISRYLKNIRETQEYIRDILSETVSSMKFQAYILTPLITGLIVSMSQVITEVLTNLGSRLAATGIGVGGPAAGIQAGNIFKGIDKAIPPTVFQFIVGIYLLEVIIILAIFLTKISYGENKVAKWNAAGKMLMIGTVVYFAVALMSSSMFVGLIRNALSSFLG